MAAVDDHRRNVKRLSRRTYACRRLRADVRAGDGDHPAEDAGVVSLPRDGDRVVRLVLRGDHDVRAGDVAAVLVRVAQRLRLSGGGIVGEGLRAGERSRVDGALEAALVAEPVADVEH